MHNSNMYKHNELDSGLDNTENNTKKKENDWIRSTKECDQMIYLFWLCCSRSWYHNENVGNNVVLLYEDTKSKLNRCIVSKRYELHFYFPISLFVEFLNLKKYEQNDDNTFQNQTTKTVFNKMLFMTLFDRWSTTIIK